jgi:DNA-binding transcriptional LysR family regulator
MIYVCRPDHALAKHKSVSLEQLHGSDFIAFARDHAARKEIDRHLRQRLTSVNIVAEYENIETIKQAVEVGLGGAILPVNSVRVEVKLGKLVSIPISPPEMVRPLGIVHKQGKVFTPAMTEFISHLIECKWDINGES